MTSIDLINNNVCPSSHTGLQTLQHEITTRNPTELAGLEIRANELTFAINYYFYN